MNIGQAARRSGVPAKTIRYYEDVDLIPSAVRRENGYRDYSDRDVEILRFLRHSRGLGFSVEECRGLLSLYEDKTRASADVKALALKHIAEMDAKIAELQSIRATLQTLADQCHGDPRPDCPILENLASPD